MRRLVLALVAVFAVMGLLAPSALAAFFHSASGSINNSGALVASFDERGLGNENIDYLLTADSTATYACINRGGKNPEAANKQTVSGDVSGGGSFEVKNGRVIASISAGPISAGSFSCPGGQRLVLADVSYTNIVLTDTTNNVDIELDDVSRTFIVLT
jgi:hypothetical protein